MDDPPQTSTLRDVAWSSAGARATWGRRLSVVLLLAVVVCGAVGLFGVHARTVGASGGGYALSVSYARTARAGLDVPLRVEVRHDGGLPQSITLAISSSYVRMLERQDLQPEPDSSSSDGQFLYLSFDVAPGAGRFVADWDAYIKPSRQVGASGEVQLIVDGALQARATLRTWLVP